MSTSRDATISGVIERDLPSDQRSAARTIAGNIIAGNIPRGTDLTSALFLLAKVVLRHCPMPVPVPVPVPAAAADDRTMPVNGVVTPAFTAAADDRTMPVGQVLGTIDPEHSDGICEESQDNAQTGVAQINHTAMHRSADGTAFVVKRGASDAVALPNIHHIPDTRR